jgi:phage terminase small subunit
MDPTGANLWRNIVGEFVIEDAASLALLEQACHAVARAESLRAHIEADGEVIRLPDGSFKRNPLIAAELAARGLIARLLGRLGVLDTEPRRGPGRPPNPARW